jgi:biotin carboxyl carrier protein
VHFKSKINNREFHLEIDPNSSIARINNEIFEYEIVVHDKDRILLRSGTRLYKFDNICVDGNNVTFAMNGVSFDAEVKDARDILLEQLGFQNQKQTNAGSLRAPMPGKILEIMVQAGDTVAAGEPLMILEAMKMENELKAPSGGKISSLLVKTGDKVEKNQNLIVISPSG